MSDASPSIVSYGFDSDSVPETDRIDHWRHGLLSTHTVELDDRVRFHASGQIWRRGDFVLTGGTMTPQTLVRDAKTIRHDQIDHYGIFTVASGARIARIHETDTRLAPGDLQIFDFSQPETSVSLGGQTTTLYLPRELIDGLIPGFSTFHGVVLQDDRAALLARHLVHLLRYLDTITGDAAESLTTLTMTFAIETLQRCLSPSGDTRPRTIVLRSEIVRFIREHLADPTLAPATLIGHFPLSRSALFRLFEDDGGVERFIRTERLRTIRICLLDRNDRRSTEELAFAFGFSSAWALTRAFRDLYGLTPSDLRREASADHAEHPLVIPSIRDLVLP